MDDNQRIQLKKLLAENKDAVDQTELIRQLKHSHIFRDNIQTLLDIKAKYNGDDEKIVMEGMVECSFMYNYYFDLFNKIKNDEINLNLLYKFIDVLEKIENGEVDQHEGSFEVGTILKEIFVDSAVRKSQKINEKHAKEEKKENTPAPRICTINISYKEFRKMKIKQ